MADSTVNVCISDYIIEYTIQPTDAYFVFSCISNDLLYSSNEIIESPINYPNQSMCPIGTIDGIYTGSNYWTFYKNYTAIGTGTYTPTI